MKLNGLGVAVITAFTNNYQVDYPAVEKIFTHLVNHGADYLVLMGTTSETITLTDDEKNSIIEIAKKINNSKLPLILGIGGYNTSHVIREIEHANLQGIDAILSVSPYYNRPTQAGIYHHFKAISEASPLPIVLYNVPSRTGSNMDASTTLKLANDFQNIIAIKEASGNFEQIMKIIHNKPADFTVISGDDSITLPLIALGAQGVISVLGNAFPGEFSQMIEFALQGNYVKAREIHFKLLDIMNHLFSEGSPVGIKALMSQMGFCTKKVRPPLYEMSDENASKFDSLLAKL